jgi:cation-transporting P-type ATPase C
MTPGLSSQFASLERVHQTHGRVRWRYHGSSPIAPSAISQAVRELTGTLQVRVNASISALIVAYDAALTSVDQLEHALLSLHFAPPRPGSKPALPSVSSMGPSLAVLLGRPFLPPMLQLPVTLWSALPILKHALADLFSHGVTSHVLEAMAVSISIAQRDLFAANATTFMLSLGEYLEDSISHQSDDLLRQLLKPVSNEAWVEQDNVEKLLPLDQVQVGDIVVVATGSIIPVDGTVLSGEASVNEASMTGESVPQTRGRGDRVLSGTLIEEGRLRIYAEQVGNNTAVARIADYVEQSLQTKSSSQLEASRLADRLVPVVLGLAGGSFALTQNWQRAAAVLQADYSCALKLATPVAFKAAMYRAGLHGMLIKGASAVERLAEVDTFVFDKTGTLTEGSLEVTDSIVFDTDYNANDLLWLAASIEEHYFHPLAQAVVAAAQNTLGGHFDHNEVEFIVAHGVASEVDGKRVVIGSRHFIEEDEGIDVSAHSAQINALYQQGRTLLYVGVGKRLIGLIGLQDNIRANSAATIQQLRQLGVRRIMMLTGDHQDRARELAQQLDIDEFHAELLPEDKARIIDNLRAQGAKIAFIGDGINDAPALSGAHVGIAMQRGADIARLSADIVLLEDDISRVADAKRLVHETMQLIHNNYRLTVGLNTGILAAASLGISPPVVTSILHNGTTLALLLKALGKPSVAQKPLRKPPRAE